MSDLFKNYGAHVIVDGQFGSTGKGAFSKWLADQAVAEGWTPDVVVSNAGPNSGHTFYHGDDKHVLKQLPTFAVAMHLMGVSIPVFLSAGAVVNPEILCAEIDRYPGIEVWVHPNAALITDDDVAAEHSGTVAAVAGTASGTGAAIARKVLRDPNAVMGSIEDKVGDSHFYIGDWPQTATDYGWDTRTKAVVEVSQGFSLGLNTRQFYPKTTSRECTVMQAMADARMPPRFHATTYMVVRTFPIRVGNHNGHSSGECYSDQQELAWADIGVAPELTTVTQRERRVFTFSEAQYTEAFEANDPDFIFVNFLNYLPDEAARVKLLDALDPEYNRSAGYPQFIGGYGPKSGDIKWLNGKS